VSKSAGSGSIWAQPEPGSRKPRFTREQIASAALAIADGEGFEAVSMRRVAAELGAGTMTLYNYVRTKDDLVALMHDAIMGEVLVPSDELPPGWRPALTVIAWRTRAALLRHPWSLASLQDAQPGPNAMRRFEQYLAALASIGLATATKFDLLSLVNSYVFGNAMITGESRARAAAAQAEPDTANAAIEFGMAQLRSGQFPHTAELFVSGAPGESVGPPMDEQGLDEQFERGLQALLDGAALRMNLPDTLPLPYMAPVPREAPRYEVDP
jgi:AcrR family transcriptional regulator